MSRTMLHADAREALRRIRRLGPVTAFLAWCMTHPFATVLFMFVIKVQARWLGYIELALTFFLPRHPIVGLFALLPSLAAWWYATRGRLFRRLVHWVRYRSRVARIED